MKIFIGKLNFDTTNEDLREVFESFGEVESAEVMIDPVFGKSKGYGFVDMPYDEEAQSAIDQLNETELDGSIIVVKKSMPR